MQFFFLEPINLVYLLALVPFVMLLRRAVVLRAKRMAALGAPVKQSRASVLFPCIVVGCLIAALARPYWGFHDIKVPRLGRDIMAVVDVSLSMAATDVSPNRVEFAKRKLRDLIEILEKSARGDRLGIVLFAGDSYLFCPLTEDYSVLRTFANSISVGLIASGGSAITQALVTATKSFQTTEAKAPALVLLSDGEDNELVLARSLDVLRGFKLTLWALGVGTPEGKPIELHSGRLLRDPKGNIVVSKLDEASLRGLAEGSGGSYRRATLDESDLRGILSEFHSAFPIRQSTEDGVVRVYNELGPLLLWLPLVLLTVLMYLGHQRLVLVLALLLAPQRSAQAEERPELSADNPRKLSAFEAQRAYQNGDFETAKQAFSSLHEERPDDRKILRGLASSEFKLKNYREAAKHFSTLGSNARNGREKFQALYDKGTADLMAGNAEPAIRALESALEIKPGDEAAAHNLEIARRLKAQQPPPPDPKPSPSPNQQEESRKQDPAPAESSPPPAPSPDASSTPPTEQESNGTSDDGSPSAPTSAPSPTTTPGQAPAEAEPSAQPGQTAESGDGTDDGDADQESNESADQSPEEPQNHGTESLEEREARAWLESLDDSPVLLRKQVGNKRTSQQQSW